MNNSNLRITQSDKQLLERWKTGDSRAGQELYRRHYGAVRRFFEARVPSDCDDLTQQTFVACLRSVDSFTGRSKFRTWLLAIARNRYADHLRRKYHRPREGTFDEQLAGGVERTRSMPRSAGLLRALRSLPREQQVVLELYYWKGRTYAEIAELLREPHGTVAARIKRARDRLRLRLMELAESSIAAETTIHGFDRWMAELREEATASARPRKRN